MVLDWLYYDSFSDVRKSLEKQEFRDEVKVHDSLCLLICEVQNTCQESLARHCDTKSSFSFDRARE
jgi:hypothetical protein